MPDDLDHDPDRIEPRPATRPLRWPDFVLDLQDLLADTDTPAYLVGGAVRDALLGRPVKDVDLATNGSGLRLAKLIADRMKGAFYPLDNERGVGRAIVDTPNGKLVFDVASFRRETLADDLADRDFTINAMAVDLHGDLNLLIDPLNGERDAITKVLRRCSPNSIPSDPLRSLRAVRQSVQLGMRIERETLDDIKANAERLHDVSAERIRDEFVRILALPNPVPALRVADAVGLLRMVVPETVALHGLTGEYSSKDAWDHTLLVVEHLTHILATISPRRTDTTAAQFSMGMIVMALDRFRPQLQEHTTYQWPDGRDERILLLLAALLHETGNTVELEGREYYEDASARIASHRATELRLSHSEVQRLNRIVENHRVLFGMHLLHPLAIYRFWRELKEPGIDAMLLALADYLGTVGPAFAQDTWIELLERVRTLLDAWYNQRDQLVDPPALVDGNTLMETLGLKRGKQIGELLEQIREAQVQGEVTTAKEAIDFARHILDPDSN